MRSVVRVFEHQLARVEVEKMDHSDFDGASSRAEELHSRVAAPAAHFVETISEL